MSDFIEFLSINELTIVIVLILLIFILLMAIIVIDIRNKRNEENEIDEDIQYDEEDDEQYRQANMEDTGELGMVANEKILEELDVDKVTKNLDKTAEIEEIKYVEEDKELEKTKALIELQTLKEELAKVDQENLLENTIETPTQEEQEQNLNTTNDNIATVSEPEPLKMEEQVNEFESKQEEKAIISVDELHNAMQNITDEEIETYEDDGNEPISLKELEDLYKNVDTINEEPVVNKEQENVKTMEEVYEDKYFKTTPVISPVYGLETNSSSIALEQTANLDKLNEEIKKTNEFLNALKELRKNLE